ncbi:MAG: prepilin-type N-terminal cleavage/methylation domain-containing protein [Myxococcota bacterium]|nr:prepilin-type N-terminal cleavage/methylation domain-containing protein [Myxococcota bacterium]
MKRQAGFTLMEVMIGLGLLGLALTVLIKSTSNSIFSARQSQMMGIATDLSRSKMYDIEELLLKDGFTDTDQSEGDIGEPEKGSQASSDVKARSGKCFEDEGWPNVCYAYRIEQVELPSMEELTRMAQGRAQQGSATGSGSGSGEEEGGFENSALGGMLTMMGGFGGGGGKGGDIEDAQSASFLTSQYTLVQQVLKVSIRKVTLVVWWDVMGRTRELKTVAFFTDASAMDKVLMGLGSQELPPEPGTGSSGGGTGSGSGSSRPPAPGGGSGRR